MYNSSLKGQSKQISYDIHLTLDGKIMYNDMSKTYMKDEFRTCDVVYSEIAWQYGYRIFNDRAENEPESYGEYLRNINKCIEELQIPAFIVCGKPAKRYFKAAKMYDIAITTSGTKMSKCTLYVWNSDYAGGIQTTDELTWYLANKYKKCLDFSCGYGEHLLKFDDFVACDINKDCLTYLTNSYVEVQNGKTKQED